ncbi:hypothetical protein [Crateriforma spongiae]|uniref:hypothetical protein n=1 Tax=Crateriforma spongiae TaxID=2724528 RepID=UPI0039AFDCF6
MAKKKALDAKDNSAHRVTTYMPKMTERRWYALIHALVMRNKQYEDGMGGNIGICTERQGGFKKEVNRPEARWMVENDLAEPVPGQPGWLQITDAGAAIALTCFHFIQNWQDLTNSPEYIYLPKDHPAAINAR